MNIMFNNSGAYNIFFKNCDPLQSFYPPVFMGNNINGVRLSLGFAQGRKDSFCIMSGFTSLPDIIFEVG